jgi:uncharacterized protein YndB with AHSA1/START domain
MSHASQTLYVTNAQEPAHERVLILERRFDAPRELVWRAWTKPRHLARWWGPAGFTLPVCEQDFRVGGFYRFCMRAPDGTDHWVWGAYHTIVEPEKLVFTWEREDQAGLRDKLNNLVTITLAPDGGGTLLNLHHSVFQTIADCNDHRGGWTQCLERLAEFLAPPV